jgi:parallel beta-helix repeat protein
MLPKPLPIIPIVRTPHAVIAIDGDDDFSDTALLERWPGDGSLENPFKIDGLDIGLSDGANHCIMISNTQVSFIIRNCNLTGFDGGAGIYLGNVTNGELVNNNCNSNYYGIKLEQSDSNTVTNNTCNNNSRGIYLGGSDYNTVADNTCNNNSRGIYLSGSDYNTVANNTCDNNMFGIYLSYSDSNTVVNNMCNNNTEHDIYLYESDSNTVENNTFLGNTEHDIFEEPET